MMICSSRWIDGATPEDVAAALAVALRPDSIHFKEVRRPDDSPFLEWNSLLYLDPVPLGCC